MDHAVYMSLAYKEALKAKDKREIPVGALIVKEDQIVGLAHNQKEKKQMVTAHAELLAINQANLSLKTWRLEGCRIYTTLEPCDMCVGAILSSRIDQLVYGCKDAHQTRFYGNKLKVISGIMEEECATLIQDFFKDLRSEKR